MLVCPKRVLMGYAKLVSLQACRDVGMRFRVHIGVDANTDGRDQAQTQRHARQHVQLGFALHIKAADTCFQGLSHLGASFTDT